MDSDITNIWQKLGNYPIFIYFCHLVQVNLLHEIFPSPKWVQASGQNSSGGAGGAVGRRKWRLGESTAGIATMMMPFTNTCVV